jgi:hypothetical protein
MPSVMLPSLFTKTGQSNPSTPLPPLSPSPFYLAEADDPDTDVQRKQAVIDPNLVSFRYHVHISDADALAQPLYKRELSAEYVTSAHFTDWSQRTHLHAMSTISWSLAPKK